MFESAVIERYRRREESVEETLIDMYPAGVSTRQVDDVCQLLWGDRMPSQTLSVYLVKSVFRVSSLFFFGFEVVPFSWTVIRGGNGHGEVQQGAASVCG